MAVYTGLFDQFELTDDEFAQIMGHEISQALANHTAERMSRAMATAAGVAVVGAASDNSGAAMARAALIANVAVTLWQKIGDLSDDRPAKFLSTHPAPDNRQAALNAMIHHMLKINPRRDKAPIHHVTIVR